MSEFIAEGGAAAAGGGADGDEDEEEEEQQIEFLGKAPKKKDNRITYMGKSIFNSFVVISLNKVIIPHFFIKLLSGHFGKNYLVLLISK